ncbi:MAG: UxaA family hydrolase [Acidobacteriaceae bacterium]
MPGECFRIAAEDNVATLLQDAAAQEELLVRGAPEIPSLQAREEIRTGHKVALRPMAAGERVIKYGFPIGETTQPIAPGQWVHLHNCRSLYDEASSSLDPGSGARTEARYG